MNGFKSDTRQRPDVTTRLWVFAATLVGSLIAAGATSAATISIDCGGMKVGEIEVDVDGNGISGGFFTEAARGGAGSLAAAAMLCNEHHFNWYQTVEGTHPLIPGGGPQVDPQPGGQGDQWADSVPWYWDEERPPKAVPEYDDMGGCAEPRCHDPALLLTAQATADTLMFSDFPFGPLETDLTFMTWLVSLNADSSFHSWHSGFMWTWMRTAAGDIVVGGPAAMAEAPTKEEYDDLIGGFQTQVPEPSVFALCCVAALICRRRLKAGRRCVGDR